jgi:hypothetical protein
LVFIKPGFLEESVIITKSEGTIRQWGVTGETIDFQRPETFQGIHKIIDDLEAIHGKKQKFACDEKCNMFQDGRIIIQKKGEG